MNRVRSALAWGLLGVATIIVMVLACVFIPLILWLLPEAEAAQFKKEIEDVNG